MNRIEIARPAVRRAIAMRLAAGESMASIARAANVHRVTLHRWLSGSRASITTETLDRLLKVLGLTIDGVDGNRDSR